MNYTEFYLTKFAAATATATATPSPATPTPVPVAKPESKKPTGSKSDGLSGKEVAGLVVLGAGGTGLGIMGLNNRGQTHLAAHIASPYNQNNILSRSGAILPKATLLDMLGIHTARQVNSISNVLVPGATNLATAAKNLAPRVAGGAVIATSGDDYLRGLGVSPVVSTMGTGAVAGAVATPGNWQRKAVGSIIGSGVNLAKGLSGRNAYGFKKESPVVPAVPAAPAAPVVPTEPPTFKPTPNVKLPDFDSIPTDFNPFKRTN